MKIDKIDLYRKLDYLDLRIENLEKIISFRDSFKLKCNYKKEEFSHSLHSENLENSHKTLNTLVDLVINFSENYKNNNKIDRINKLEQKIDIFSKNIDYLHNLAIEKRNLNYKIEKLEKASAEVLGKLNKLIEESRKNNK